MTDFMQNMDEFEVVAERVRGKRPADVKTVTGLMTDWWRGLADGTIKLVRTLPLLTDYIPAYIPGHLLVVAGYTSAGKSQLLAQMIADAAGVKKAKVEVFSVEDSQMEKLMTILSTMTGVGRRRMVLGEIDAGEREYLEEMAKLAQEGWSLSIHDDVYDLDEMELIVSDNRPELVFVDYVQNLRMPQDGIYERMSHAALRLFQMGERYRATMVLVSQISNEGAKDQESGLMYLKGAGELAALAHAVVQLRKNRSEIGGHEVELSVKKNKAFGGCGTIDCAFDKTWTRIVKAEERDG